ncbi:hypothetical protein [Dongshaea marina]|uniref:hypothetical protein n=1 Tax=Dongshaea marina TaxID=2047966 RepID=UPI000D3E3BEA|nr:hypothetical protein [Dongshaea marina]
MSDSDEDKKGKWEDGEKKEFDSHYGTGDFSVVCINKTEMIKGAESATNVGIRNHNIVGSENLFNFGLLTEMSLSVKAEFLAKGKSFTLEHGKIVNEEMVLNEKLSDIQASVTRVQGSVTQVQDNSTRANNALINVIDRHIETSNERLTTAERNLESTQQRLSNIGDCVEQIGLCVADVDSKVENIQDDITTIENRVESVETNVQNNSNSIIAGGVAMFGLTLAMFS